MCTVSQDWFKLNFTIHQRRAVARVVQLTHFVQCAVWPSPVTAAGHGAAHILPSECSVIVD